MFYVEPGANGIMPLPDTVTLAELEAMDLSRVFATILGASRHPDAHPVTAFRRPVQAVQVYVGGDVIANGWKVAGLRACGVIADYQLEG